MASALALSALLGACGTEQDLDAPEPDAAATEPADAGGGAADAQAAEPPDAAVASPDSGNPDGAPRYFTPPPLLPSDVKQGDKGLPVGQLQFELKLATGKYLDEDGDFGPATLSLLHTFQTSAGLAQSTVADAATRKKLEAAANAGADALVRSYGSLPAKYEVPPVATVKSNVDAVQVVAGQGDKTGTYNGRVGFAWGDGAESTSIRQGSPAHLDWVATPDTSASERRVIGVISRNEGPFDAVNSYDAGNYTWGAYQLIGSYRAYAYDPIDDELSQGLAYMKELDPESFWFNFQRYGLDVGYTLRTDGTLVKSSVAVSLLLTDGTKLTGKQVWEKVGTTTTYNQIFINAGQDPRIHRTEVLSAKRVHFDALDVALATGRPTVRHYLTSERAVCAFLDLELNRGRSSALSNSNAAVNTVCTARTLDPANPDGWPEASRGAIEADVLQEVLTRVQSQSTAYYSRMQRVLGSYFVSDVARSFTQ